MHLVNTESWHGRGFRNRPFSYFFPPFPFFSLVKEMIWAQKVSADWESWPEASGLTGRLLGHSRTRTETKVSIFKFCLKSLMRKNIYISFSK